MTDTGSRRGAANLGTLFMIVSFLVMIGFLVWLGTTAEGTESVAIQEDTAQADTTGEGGAVRVTLRTLADSASAYVGELIRLDQANVTSSVGRWGFFVELGEQGQSNPFLVKLDSTLMARGQGLPQGSATVVGTLHPRTDSIMDAWIEANVFSESDRPLLQFATHYIEARRVQATGGSGGGGGQGGAGGQGGGAGGGGG